MIPGLKKRTVNFHDVLMYVAIGRKHFRLMVLLIAAMMLFGLNWYVFARPSYEAKGLIRLNFVPLQVNPDPSYRDNQLGALNRELTGVDNTRRTAEALGIHCGVKEFYFKYIFKQSANIDSEKNLLVEIFPNSPELGRAWIPELVKQLEVYRESEHVRRRQAIVDKFEERFSQLHKAVAEKRDAKFGQREDLDVLRAQINANILHSVPSDIVLLRKRLGDISRVKMSLSDPNLDIVAKLSLISSLDAQKDALTIGEQVNVGSSAVPDADPVNNAPAANQAEPKPAAAAGNSAPIVVVPSMVKPAESWETLDKDRREIEDDIKQKSQIYRSGHHVMRELQKSLDEVNRKLGVELSSATGKLDTEFQDVQNRIEESTAKLGDYEKSGKQMQQIEEETRMFDGGTLPYARMLESMNKELAAFDYAEDKDFVYPEFERLVEFHDEAISPSKGKIIIVSLFLGIMLAIGIPFLLEYLDHTMSNLEQVESAFQMRGLGIVPKLSEYGADRPLLSQSPDKSVDGNLLENFRVIRTNLLSMGALTKAPHVIMIASAMPKEGKTVVSSNLAVSFSQTGTRTLLIDTDLRRGRMHRLFGYRKSPGLSDVLLGECTLDEAIRPTGHENLSILSAGKHVEAGAELLGSERFRAVMDQLREKFERVVMDTPPVLGLSETSVLQSLVDGVLFVIWSGNTPVRTMRAAIEMLQANGANFYGFVLNRLDLTAATNYYQYYYYSYDYYYSTQTIENT